MMFRKQAAFYSDVIISRKIINYNTRADFYEFSNGGSSPISGLICIIQAE
jgi:hypothetical protein